MRLTIKRFLTALLFLCLIASSAAAEKWAFAVIGDNRAAFASYRDVLNEIRMQTVNPGNEFPSLDLVMACGDLDPVEENYALFKEVFKSKMPSYFPVRGNHDGPADVQFILQEILPPYGKSINRQDEKDLNYFTDWNNARLIVLDQYSSFGKSFDSDAALKWLESALKAPDHIRHIFVAFHEPYLPEHAEKDPFWNLLAGQDRVRAVFAAHTHTYAMQRFPDKTTGIFFVNSGNAGRTSHSDNRLTIVEVMVNGEKVSFRVIQAVDGTASFSIREEWEIKAGGGD
jgi:hypothetical protein